MRVVSSALRGTLTITALVLATVATCAVQAADDRVIMDKGDPLVGTVTHDEIGKVQVSLRGGGAMTPPVDKVVDIVWDIGSTDFQEGMREHKAGHFSNAAAALSLIVEEEVTRRAFRKVALPYVYYLLGDSYYRSGKPKEAAQVLSEFMKNWPSSRYVPKALQILVDSAIQSGSFTDVPPLLEKLKGLGPDFQAWAVFYKGELLLAQNKPTAAANEYASAANASTSPGMKALANLGQARCAVMKKELDKAKQMAEAALKTASESEVLGTAHLIVGRVLFSEAEAAGGDDAKVAKLLDAVLEFLRVPLQYSGDDRTEPEALFRAGESFLMLSKFPGRKSDKRRAQSMYSTVIKNYPGSRWAGEARKMLAKAR